LAAPATAVAAAAVGVSAVDAGAKQYVARTADFQDDRLVREANAATAITVGGAFFAGAKVAKVGKTSPSLKSNRGDSVPKPKVEEPKITRFTVDPPATKVKTGDVTLLSREGAKHIINSNETGGGHKWPGRVDVKASGLVDTKTPFPKGWSESKIEEAISDVLTSPTSTGFPGAAKVAKGKPSSTWLISGTHDGIKLKAILRPYATDSTAPVRSGYPERGQSYEGHICKPN